MIWNDCLLTLSHWFVYPFNFILQLSSHLPDYGQIKWYYFAYYSRVTLPLKRKTTTEYFLINFFLNTIIRINEWDWKRYWTNILDIFICEPWSLCILRAKNYDIQYRCWFSLEINVIEAIGEGESYICLSHNGWTYSSIQAGARFSTHFPLIGRHLYTSTLVETSPRPLQMKTNRSSILIQRDAANRSIHLQMENIRAIVFSTGKKIFLISPSATILFTPWLQSLLVILRGKSHFY